MIEITVKFANYEEAEAALRRLKEPVSTAPTQPLPTATPTVATTPAPPTVPIPAPPVATISPDGLADLMQIASDKLVDKGVACMKIIADLGVSGIAEMSPAQLTCAATQVEAL